MERIICPLCKKPCGSALAFLGHSKREHPGAEEALRPIFRRALAQERRDRFLEQATEPDKEPAVLLRLYRNGCPCGKTYDWHVENAARFGRTP